MPDAATADDLGFVPHTQTAGNDLGFVPHTQQAPTDDLGFTPIGRIQQPPSSTPATDQAAIVGGPQDFTTQDAVAAYNRSPQWLKNASDAFSEVVGGFVPKSAQAVADFLTPAASLPAEAKQIYGAANRLIAGQPLDQVIKEQYPESQVLAEAEKTPAYSKERFAAGFGTVANLLMGGQIAHGLVRGVEPSGVSRMPEPSAPSEAGPSGQPPPPATEVQYRPLSQGPPVEPAVAPEAAQVQGTPEMARVQPEVAVNLSDPNVPFEHRGPSLALKLDDGTIIYANDLRLHSQVLERSGVDPSRVVDSGVYRPLSKVFESKTPDTVTVYPQPEVAPATESAAAEPTGAAMATPEPTLPVSASQAEKTAWRQSHGVYAFEDLSPEAQQNVLNNFPEFTEIPEAQRADELSEYSFSKEGGEPPAIIKRQGDQLYARSITGAGEVSQPEVRPRVGETPPLRPAVEEPATVQGDVGGGAAEPAPQEAPVSEQAPIGVAERYAEAEMPGSVIPGTRQDASYWKARGRDYINQGGDPRMPIRAADAGHVSPRNVGIVSAEHERLVQNRRAAADALEANPRDPVAQKNYEAADNAARAWRQEMQPVLTRAGESLGAIAGQEPVDLSTFDGLHEAAMEANGGQPLTIGQKADLMKRAGKAREYRQAEAKANGARDEVLNKTLPKTKPLTPPEMSDMVERMKQRMTPCT